MCASSRVKYEPPTASNRCVTRGSECVLFDSTLINVSLILLNCEFREAFLLGRLLTVMVGIQRSSGVNQVTPHDTDVKHAPIYCHKYCENKPFSLLAYIYGRISLIPILHYRPFSSLYYHLTKLAYRYSSCGNSTIAVCGIGCLR
jgi:hypothetical protein